MKTPLALIASCVFAVTAFAQDAPFFAAPTTELAAFEAMLGNWEGQGAFIAGPGGEELTWSGVTTAKRILGGHVIQEDMRVEMDSGTLVMRTLYGFDRERDEIVCHEFSNMGCTSPTVRWLDQNTLHAVSSGISPQEQPYLQRWTATFSGDTYSFVMERAEGNGPFFTHVTGEWKRGGDSFVADQAKAVPMVRSGKDEMARLGRMQGEFDLAGEVTPPVAFPCELIFTESPDVIDGA